ncbi:protein of unknown function [uncultured Sphingopyxis sp.]|uniref:Uncharacterized protein n=1 Tax=uncultured Sphingopyxis sp. TaxID=310581 RepID=A0A1Y5PTI2_9SPHN|nr:protein of unknown function [uncultured Sphingopyxis sp.]
MATARGASTWAKAASTASAVPISTTSRRSCTPDEKAAMKGPLWGGERPFPTFVIPAKAGTQRMRRLTPHWVPAFAGMTSYKIRSVAFRSISDIRHPGLDPGSILSTLREWTPDQVRGDE